MSGYDGDLSPSQEETLQRFRRAVQDFPNKPEDTDHYYLRWLRARKFDLDKAVEMFRNHLQWREEFKIDDIFDWTPPEVLQKHFPGGFFGEDRDGHPVYYDFYGNLDFKGLFKSCKKEDIIRFKVLTQGEITTRTVNEFSANKGQHIETITAVLNMENLSYQRQFYLPSIQTVKKLMQIFAENYPERTKQVFIINAPPIFTFGYNLVSRFMEEDTKKKLIVLGDNWQEELQKYISPDQLPQAYGGTCCEPDPQCTAYINWGGDVPERYYLTNLTETKKEDMEQVIVRRRSSYQLEVNVEKEGSLIKWEYTTSNNYDIGFGVFYKPDTSNDDKEEHTNDMHPVVPTTRRNSHVIPESGFYHCSTTGTYVVQFDNTHCWTRSKEVMYSIEVLPPELMSDLSLDDGCTPSCKEEKELMDNFEANTNKMHTHLFNEPGGLEPPSSDSI